MLKKIMLNHGCFFLSDFVAQGGDPSGTGEGMNIGLGVSDCGTEL